MSVEVPLAPRSRNSPTRRAPMPRAPPVTTILLPFTLTSGHRSRAGALQDGDDTTSAVDFDEIAGLDPERGNGRADHAGNAVLPADGRGVSQRSATVADAC